VRNPDHADDLRAVGAEALVGDVEAESITPLVAGADAVVMAAGAGPGSGAARKRTVDYGGAVELVEAALQHEIRRYVMVSSIGSNRPERWTEDMRPYFEAKAEADKVLIESGLDYTIIRPGGLTDDPGTGQVSVGDLEYGKVSRDDVAAVLAEVLRADNAIGKAFDLVGGDTPIPEAVASL
jgi:uncharacterized protein YbjT (DUF2867 family)